MSFEEFLCSLNNEQLQALYDKLNSDSGTVLGMSELGTFVDMSDAVGILMQQRGLIS